MNKPKRTHNPAWQDTTRNTRQQDRNRKLNEVAREAGWENWSEYATACMKRQVTIKRKAVNSGKIH